MAKLPMSRVTIAGARQSRKGLLEFVQRRGVLELIDREDDGFFRQTETDSQVALFERRAASAEAALAVLDDHWPEKKSLVAGLCGRKEITVAESDEDLRHFKRVFAAVSDVNALQQQLNDCKAEVVRLNAQLAELEPWLPLDVTPGTAGTLRTAVFIGAVGYETNEAAFATLLTARVAAETDGDVGFVVECVSSGRELSALVVVTNRSCSESVGNALRALGFSRPSMLGKELPRDRYEELHTRREALLRDVDLIVDLIAGFTRDRPLIRFFADYYRMRSEKYRVLGQLWQSRNTFIMTGFVAAKYAEPLAAEIERRFDACVELEACDPQDETVPVVLENGWFAKPVENIVEMYSMPGPNDLDPTSLMSFFFYLFFGMMLADAGYGLVMILATSLILRKLPLEQRMRNNMKMFLFCGISTTFWGFMFGSFFGDAISAFTKNFLGNEIVLRPLWLDPVKEPMTMLIFGIALGFVQIFIGMGANVYLLCRQGKVLDAILDVGVWYLVLGGLLAWLAGMVTGLTAIGSVGMWTFLVGLAGLLIFGGRKSKHLLGKIFGGVPKIYSITSYVSDALSYSRLMALGLASGVIAQVFNLLGSLGSGFFGILVFIVVFCVGHAINMGINALGAYVHTIRLQYVEFFNKFYEGGGRPLVPFTTKTKYVRIKED